MHSRGSEMALSIRANKIPSNAFKIHDIVFEKIEEGKKGKGLLVTGSRDPYYATLKFALQISVEKLQSLLDLSYLRGRVGTQMK